MIFPKNVSQIHSFIKSDFTLILVIVLGWQLTLLVIGNVLDAALVEMGKSTLSNGIFSHTLRWDAGWLIGITDSFYKNNPASAAFYPLFPLAVSAVHVLSFGLISMLAAGFIINVAASFLATFGLFKICLELFKQRKVAFYVILLFVCFPTAFFMHAFYTEAVFCAIAFWAYYFALRCNWLWSCLLLAILTACRLPALLFILLCGLEYLRSVGWNFKSINKKSFYFLLTPLGFIFYGLFLTKVNGDFLGMFSAYEATDDWSYQVFSLNIFEPIAKVFKNTAALILGQAPMSVGAFNYNVMPALCLLLLMSTSVFALVRIRSWAIPLGVFGIASTILFTLNSNVVSFQRYALPSLVIYLCIGWVFKNKGIGYKNAPYFLLPAISLMLQISLFCLFVFEFFVG